MKLASLLLLFTLASCTQPKVPSSISQVKLNSSESDSSYLLDSYQLSLFKQAVATLAPLTGKPDTAWTHTFDITSENHGGRWLYNRKTGHIAKLNYFLKPRYQVKDYSTFNQNILK